MEEIQQWLENPSRDYGDGVSLFIRYGKNKALVRYFQTGTARFRMSKLIYEMGKILRSSPVRAGLQVGSSMREPSVKKVEVRSGTRKVEIPDFILAAKKEISTLYSLIDRRHLELYDLGTSNADDVVRKRKRILDSRKPVIETADTLYRLKEEWFALDDGPARKRVEDLIRGILSAPADEHPSLPVREDDGGIPDVRKLSDIQLSQRRNQLRSSITKTQNMLRYQSIRKAESPSPMPDGPKRDEYEKRLRMRKAEFKAVCDELERRVR